MHLKLRPYKVRYWNSDHHQCSFLGIPKCGSTTVRLSLDMNDKEWTYGPIYEDTFTLIRNPIDRIKSGYQEVLRRGTKRPGTTDFNSFIESILDHGFFDEHIIPMVKYFRRVNKVYTLKNIPELVSKYGEVETLGNISDPYEINIDSGTMKLIQLIYKEDFELYQKYA